jgi:hypothetical protein
MMPTATIPGLTMGEHYKNIFDSHTVPAIKHPRRTQRFEEV